MRPILSARGLVRSAPPRCQHDLEPGRQRFGGERAARRSVFRFDEEKDLKLLARIVEGGERLQKIRDDLAFVAERDEHAIDG